MFFSMIFYTDKKDRGVWTVNPLFRALMLIIFLLSAAIFLFPPQSESGGGAAISFIIPAFFVLTSFLGTLYRDCCIFDLFDGIYGIEENKLHGKPEASSYLNAVRDKGFSVENTLFLDDLPKYIKGYTALGGKAVLIDHEGRFSNLPLTEETPFARLQSVHELPALLDKINNPDASGAEKRRVLTPSHK